STWTGAKVDHSTFTIATNCASCHNGSAASGKDANHIQTTANCTSCHKSGFGTSWLPAKYHANVPVVTGCASCHATSAYGLTAKPNTTTHNGVTVCETCHKSTSSWSNVLFTHAPANAVGTGTCDTCHNGSTSAVSKTAAHIPVPAGAAKCDSCHRSQVSFSTAVTMNHAVVSTASCKSCHSGNYASQGNNGGAMAKPGNHIPESQLQGGAAMDCNTCHSSTTSWASQKMNHNSSMGNGSGWCKSCHATGMAYLGNMEKKALTHEAKKGTVPSDCSMSGCHKPLGSKGAAYSKWD
ncbi:MAG: cytochrome C family protein, partial [Comamonadaceae bacterium]